MLRVLAIAGVCAALGLAACGDDEEPTAAGDPAADATVAESPAESGEDRPETPENVEGQPEAEPTADDQPKPGVVVEISESQFGEILFDGERRAIYIFDKESGPTSECYGDCATAWPPVLTKGEPQAEGSVDPKLLGTTERDDGTTQVTYDGRPLYYYVDDPPGEALCHNVFEFGGLWLVLGADGAPLA